MDIPSISAIKLDDVIVVALGKITLCFVFVVIIFGNGNTGILIACVVENPLPSVVILPPTFKSPDMVTLPLTSKLGKSNVVF